MRISLVLVLLANGCIWSNYSRTGNHYPSKPKDCALEWMYGDMSKAMQVMATRGLEQVGNVVIFSGGGTVPDELNDKLKRLAQPDGCYLGGELMVLTGSGRDQNASFMVLRKADPSAATTAQ